MPLLSQWIKKTMENVSFSIVFLVRSTGICPLGRASKRRQASCFFQTFNYGCFSRAPAYNYAVRATIYDKTKKETSNEISFFVVRSTGIEAVFEWLKSFIYQDFSHLLAKNTPINLALRNNEFIGVTKQHFINN